MTARLRRLVRPTSARVLLGLVAAATLIHAGPVSADSTSAPALGGYQGIASASGIHVLYNPEGVLPVGAPVDVGAPDSYATIASGPATFARAAVADPGDLLANPDALLALGASGYKAGTIPPYPYRITASSGAGAPSSESTPAPGLNARVSADPKGSVATATMPAGTTPAIATFGTLASTATTTTDGSTVTVHARSEIGNFNLLGVLMIDSIITDLTATSDGTTTTVDGGTTIGGAKVLGNAVVIDEQGVHADPNAEAPANSSLLGGVLNSLTAPLINGLNDTLSNAGIHVAVAGAEPVTGGTSGQIGANGLRIDVEISDRTFPQLKTLVDAVPYIPPLAPGVPGVSDVLKVAQARHIAAIEIGRSLVTLTARTARSAKATPAAVSSGSTGATGSTPGAATTTRTPGSTSSPTGATPAVAAAVLPAETEPEVPVGVGIGALVLLALLVQPFLGGLLARGSTTLLAADQLNSCPMEER